MLQRINQTALYLTRFNLQYKLCPVYKYAPKVNTQDNTFRRWVS